MKSSLVFVLFLALPVLAEPPLKERLQDQNADGHDHWIYNDLAVGFEEAKRTNRPLFVTFRCVPCKACMQFDALVAGDDPELETLAKKFVPVRQVEMKGVDLSQFQFDCDLNWAAMFLNADGTVYARYGTQSEEGPDAYNSPESLAKTMQRFAAREVRAPRLSSRSLPTRPEKPGLQRESGPMYLRAITTLSR